MAGATNKKIKVILSETPTVKGALGRLGMMHPNPATLMVTASVKTKATPEAVWQTWSQIEKWSAWGAPLIGSARWLEGREWEVGTKIEHINTWGFPFGRTVSIDTVREVNPGQSVSWWKSAKGIKSCHIWFFEPLREGGTRITKTEVFVGFTIMLNKPVIKKKWQGLFQQAVEGLARAVERNDIKVPTGTAPETAQSYSL